MDTRESWHKQPFGRHGPMKVFFVVSILVTGFNTSLSVLKGWVGCTKRPALGSIKVVGPTWNRSTPEMTVFWGLTSYLLLRKQTAKGLFIQLLMNGMFIRDSYEKPFTLQGRYTKGLASTVFMPQVTGKIMALMPIVRISCTVTVGH